MAKKFFQQEQGFVTLIMSIFVIVAMISIGSALSNMIISQHQISNALIKSLQSDTAAEGGIEDGLLRLRQTLPYLSPYGFGLASSTVQVTITSGIGSAMRIVSQADTQNIIKKIEAVYELNADKVSFFFGAQAGDGGVSMANGSRVKGNIFSNGSIVGSGSVDNNVVVAKNGNRIEGLTVGENAMAYSCKDCQIGKDLTYVQGGTVSGCVVGGLTVLRATEIPSENMPISQEEIDGWKLKASSGGIINDNYTVDSDQSLGPVQIGTPDNPKNLTIINGVHLTIDGTIFVTGNIIFENNAIISLSPSHGTTGGIIMADGRITVSNNVILQGSGLIGSYLLVLSTNNSLDPVSPAIVVYNNAQGAVFYTSQGLIVLSNNIKAREITGYKIRLDNNAEVEYETGLASALFSSGTGGSWILTQWREIE